MKTTPTKRKPTDTTLRNARASVKRDQLLANRITRLTARVYGLEADIQRLSEEGMLRRH